MLDKNMKICKIGGHEVQTIQTTAAKEGQSGK